MNTLNAVDLVSRVTHEIRGSKYLALVWTQVFFALIFVGGKLFGMSFQNATIIGIGLLALFATYEILSWDSQRTISYVNQANGLLSVVGGTLFGLCLDNTKFPMEIFLFVVTQLQLLWVVIVVTVMIASVLATINVKYFGGKYDEVSSNELCSVTNKSVVVCYLHAAMMSFIFQNLF